MIIDGHSHACGKFLTAESIVRTLDKNGVDRVVLVPGELNSRSEYTLPNSSVQSNDDFQLPCLSVHSPGNYCIFKTLY